MIEEYLKDRLKKKSLGVMAHIVCGYPSFDANWEILEEMDRAGVDVVEMQFPFSEPIADGPLFLMANQASLDRGTRVADCFALMKRASEHFSFKILMMGYYNTVFVYGENEFCDALKSHGGTGMIIPDLPIEEGKELIKACVQRGLDFIRLVSPTNTEARLKEVLNEAGGLVYAVARTGVTGSKTKFSPETEAYLKLLKKHSHVPVAVGFGISQSSDLEYLREKADMAVLGTAVLQAYLEKGKEGVRTFFEELGT